MTFEDSKNDWRGTAGRASLSTIDGLTEVMARGDLQKEAIVAIPVITDATAKAESPEMSSKVGLRGRFRYPTRASRPVATDKHAKTGRE